MVQATSAPGLSAGITAPAQPRPAWCRQLDVLIDRAVLQLSVISSCTPRNLAAELAALENDFAAGRFRAPQFVYRKRSNDDWLRRLGAARDEVLPHGPWGSLYAARLHELWLEAQIGQAVDSPDLSRWAAERYARRDVFHDEADALCAEWLDESPPRPAEEMHTSDDEADPESLVSRLRVEVGRQRIPFRVEVVRGLSALAATGPKSIFVAAGRTMSKRDVARTVLHEVEGHALPRARALAFGGLFVRGTAFGSDDQEGRALGLEDGAGFLRGARRRELALRHQACAMTREGADFVTVARTLHRFSTGWADALRVTSRAQRGGAATGGLMRESVYLPAYLRVKACLEAHADADRWLGAGQIATSALPALRRLCPAAGDIETKS